MRIALIVNILNEEFQISVYNGVKEECERLGIELVCFQLEGIKFSIESFASKFPANSFFNVDGIILATSSLPDGYEISDKAQLEKLWPGIKFISHGLKIANVPSLVIQTDSSMKLLVEHLIRVHNYKKFLFIGGYFDHTHSKDRKYIFEKTLEIYKNWFSDIEYTVKDGDFSEIFGTQAMEEYFDENNCLPDAVVCANDNMAIGVLKYLRITNQTQAQCAVTGLDDIPQGKYMVPALTTVHQPLKESGLKSVQLLNELLLNNKCEKEVYIESALVVRNSCGCARPQNYKQGHIEEIQEKYVQSEQLLRILGYLGRELIFCQSETSLRRILDDYLKQLEINNFYVYGFENVIEDTQIEDINNVLVKPIYVRSNGVFQSDLYDNTLPLNNFLSNLHKKGLFEINNKILKFMSIDNKLVGTVIYEGNTQNLSFLCSMCVYISQALLCIHSVEQETKRAEFLEMEVSKRTEELVKANDERLKVEAEVLKISEMERHRFSLDLHDDICQRLAGISMLCRSYSRMEEGIKKHEIEELAALINDTLQRTRQYAHNSYPVELESLGLKDTISNLCNSFVLQTKINCDYKWEISQNIGFTNTQRLNTFRIIQEALHNIQKHANAKNITVNLFTKKGNVCVEICDDGKGFSINKNTKKGLGISSMQYRANQINATFEITKNAPKGTKISFSFKV